MAGRHRSTGTRRHTAHAATRHSRISAGAMAVAKAGKGHGKGV